MQQTSAKKNIRLDMTGWGRWSTGKCARNWNFTILPNAQPRINLGEWGTQHSIGFLLVWFRFFV